MKMKQTILMSGLSLCCLTVQAVDATRGLIDSCDWAPIQLSIAPPAQLFSSDTRVYGLRLNLLMGYNSEMSGIDIGSLFAQADWMSGIQVSFWNQAETFVGIQLGAFNSGGFVGPPFLSEKQKERFTVGSHSSAIKVGVKGSVFPKRETERLVVGSHSSGIQIGVVNSIGRREPFFDSSSAPLCSLSGLQLGGFNSAGELAGIQIGLRNEADNVRGVQIGLRNYARNLHGVQIGLLNTAENGFWINTRGCLGPDIDQLGVPIVNVAF